MTALLSGNALAFPLEKPAESHTSNLVKIRLSPTRSPLLEKLKSYRRSLLIEAGPLDMRKHGA